MNKIQLGKAIVTSQAQDQSYSIPYRPQFTRITGKVSASILLQQISYWWHIKGRKPFYKFRAACDHDWCKEGDSWAEELGMTTGGFDTALKAIGAKVTKGKSKSELLKNNLVIYWTDSNRVTWYQLNEELFYTLVYLAYNEPKLLGKSGFRNRLDKSEKHIYLYSETTPETTRHGADAPLAPVVIPSEQSESEDEPLIEQFFGPRQEPKPATATPHWRDAIKEPWALWGVESEEFRHQLERYGMEGRRVQQLGYEFEQLTGLAPVWHDKAKVKRWSSGLHGALQEAKGDTRVVLEATRKALEDGLTISSPWSVHEVTRAMVGAQKRPAIDRRPTAPDQSGLDVPNPLARQR